MSKIDKDLDPSKLKSSLEEYKYGDWESVAELEDFLDGLASEIQVHD